MTASLWEQHFERLREQYPYPASVPNLDLPPGATKMPAEWRDWARLWKEYYEKSPYVFESQPDDGRPPMPAPGSSREAWIKWAQDIGEHAAKTQSQDQAQAS